MKTTSEKVKSPAKVNLCLYINFKREDGYHDISSIMIPVSIYDELSFTVTESSEIKVSADSTDIPSGKDNLVYKAAELIQKTYSVTAGITIRINKQIPSGAGLGGGSSNAATAFITLNRLWDLNLSKNELKALGKTIGADIPFFIEESPSLIGGIGDIVKPVKVCSEIWLVIINPNLHVSTKYVYEHLNLALTKKDKDINNFLRLLASEKVSPKWTEHMHNDLEAVTFERHPELKRIKSYLAGNGAVASLMAGSGSSVFGVFSSREEGEKVYRSAEGRYNKVYLAKALT